MLQNLSVPKKLVLSFAAVIAACGLATSLVFFALLAIQNADQRQSEAREISDRIQQVQVALLNQQLNLRGYVAVPNEDFKEGFEEHTTAFTAALADFAVADVNGQFVEEQKALAEAGKAFTDEARQMMAQASDPEQHAASVASLAAKGRITAVRAPGAAVLRGVEAIDTKAEKARDAAFRQAFVTFVAGGTLALAIAVASALWLISALSKPVVSMTRAMDRLSHGDLEVAIPAVGRKDEIGQMADAVLTFKEQAQENRRLAAETEQARAAREEERTKVETERAKAAEEARVAVEAMAEGLAALARGDLTHRITANITGNAAVLKADFNASAEKLETAVSIIIDRASAIGAAAHQISEAADDLSRRTEQQAASLEETAAAVEQITSTVARSAEGALEAGSMVRSSQQYATEGQTVVNRAVSAMGQIEESSNRIGAIIGVIDEIAFQTNLLALNAGVEAARAGDAGRGFAVVASEVRALAQRSAEAAKEIKTLIQASGQQVGQGVDLVNETGKALERIAVQITNLTTIAVEIESSSKEQATGLAEVNVAVSQMDQVTQQNAAMVEEATAASRSLAQDASDLDRLMGQFQISRHQRAAAAA
ncbi:chemotaxis protein [Brevundimonas sp. GN22]